MAQEERGLQRDNLIIIRKRKIVAYIGVSYAHMGSSTTTTWMKGKEIQELM